MKRNKKTEQEKELRRLYQEYKKTWRDRRGETIELDEPYQKGWKRYYVLREDIKNRRDAHVIARLLDKINTTIYSGRKDFQVYDSTLKKWKSQEHKLDFLSEKEYEALNEQERAFFSPYFTNGVYTLSGFWDFSGRGWWKVYAFNKPYMFVPKTVPHMITHRWIPDEEWESRCQELRNKIYGNNLWPKITKYVFGGDTGYRDPKDKRFIAQRGFEDDFCIEEDE